jgi:hypothetical protein
VKTSRSRAAGVKVVVDGKPLLDDTAAALWRRFSAWMEAHAGDLGGFAASEGFARVHPEIHDGTPVLIASRSGTQSAYAPAPRKPGTRARRR